MGRIDIDLRRAGRAFAFTSALGLLALASLPNQAHGQSGGPYLIRRATIDGGGATAAVGGAYSAGGTLGQPDAGSISATGYSIGGGFWGGGTLIAAPTPTASLTPTPSRTVTAVASSTHTPTATPTVPATRTPTIPVGAPTSTPSRTGNASATPLRTPTATPTLITSATPSPSPATVTATPSPTATTTPPQTDDCAGDCDASGAVSVDELVRGVNIALERAALSLCPAMNSNGDGRITVNELVAAVNAALRGCSD